MEQTEEQILDWESVVWPGETTWRGLLLPALSHLDAAQPWTSERVLENRLSAREAQLTLLPGQVKTQASRCVPSCFSFQVPLPGLAPCHEQTRLLQIWVWDVLLAPYSTQEVRKKEGGSAPFSQE